MSFFYHKTNFLFKLKWGDQYSTSILDFYTCNDKLSLKNHVHEV